MSVVAGGRNPPFPKACRPPPPDCPFPPTAPLPRIPPPACQRMLCQSCATPTLPAHASGHTHARDTARGYMPPAMSACQPLHVVRPPLPSSPGPAPLAPLLPAPLQALALLHAIKVENRQKCPCASSNTMHCRHWWWVVPSASACPVSWPPRSSPRAWRCWSRWWCTPSCGCWACCRSSRWACPSDAQRGGCDTDRNADEDVGVMSLMSRRLVAALRMQPHSCTILSRSCDNGRRAPPCSATGMT